MYLFIGFRWIMYETCNIGGNYMAAKKKAKKKKGSR